MNRIRTPAPRRPKYLPLIQRLLAIRTPDLGGTLSEASTLIAELFEADKVDCYVIDEAAATLVALGTSQTPLSRHQARIGLDRIALSRGGRLAEVFLHQRSHLTGHADRDPLELPEIVGDLGIRSLMAVPLFVETTCRGVLVVGGVGPAMYVRDDLALLDTIGHWIGLVLQRDDPRGARPEVDAPKDQDASETINQLKQECLRLRSEMLYWQSIADELLMELHRRELQASRR